MFKGNRSTAKRESDVNALAGVKSPPRKVNIPNDVSVTTTGMLFSIKLLNCKNRGNWSEKLQGSPEKMYYHILFISNLSRNEQLLIHMQTKKSTQIINLTNWS